MEVSCCGNTFLQEGQGNWSEIRREMDGDKYMETPSEKLVSNTRKLGIRLRFTIQVDNNTTYTCDKIP